MGDSRALRPTLMAAVPEILERIRKAVHTQVQAGSPLKQAIFNYAYAYKKDQVEKESVSNLLEQFQRLFIRQCKL